MSRIIVGLDIGSSTIRTLVCEMLKNGKLNVISVLKSSSDGLRKGMIDDLPAATRALSVVMSDLKQISKEAIKNIYLGVGAPNVRIQASRGIVAVSRADLEITKDDILRAKEAAESIKLPANRMIVHALTDEFVVDDISDIKDPLGMVGNRLEAKTLIIDAFAPAINNLARCLEIAGGSFAGLIFNPIASSRAVLTKNQKDLGVILVDIGAGTTSFSVYQEGKLLHTGAFPAGSGHVTSDLALGLKVPIVAAENIKFSFGNALSKDVPLRESVEMAKFDSNARGQVSRRFVSEIIEARLAEIFEFIHTDLRHIGRSAQLPGGAVFVGAGAKIPGLVDLARQELKLPARIGIPDLSPFNIESSETSEMLEDPEFACSIGLVSWGADRMFGDIGARSSVFEKISGLFKYFMP